MAQLDLSVDAVKEYERKRMDAHQAAALVRSGDLVWMPSSHQPPSILAALAACEDELRDVLTARGLFEAQTPAFAPAGEGDVEVANPLATTEPFMRRSLLPALLRRLEYNLARGNRDVRLFEIGTSFREAFWGLFLIVIIMGGIYGHPWISLSPLSVYWRPGAFTPTEAAAVAAMKA